MPSTVQASIQSGERMLQLESSAEPIPFNREAMERVREQMPELMPVPLGLEPSFGFGDRTGLATPGHVEAMRRAGAGIRPIFAQQSVREMQRTDRDPRGVIDDALFGLLLAGWSAGTGADADHLKTRHDAQRAFYAGYSFFTIDPSGYVDNEADGADEETLRKRFRDVRDQVYWFDQYRGQSVELDTGTTVELDEEACMRCAVKYGPAMNHAIELASYIKQLHADADRYRGYEIEVSIDETDQPTALAEHYIIADQCLSRGVRLVSLAPRFPGELEKGIDYKGDIEELERALNDHAALARQVGPYKLSLHSGSDKLSMYRLLAKATQGRFHVKTAGTSYLEALRVAARHDEALFRRIIGFARECYETDRATYHLSAKLEDLPGADEVEDAAELERIYLGNWGSVPEGEGFTEPGRQVLHCTFGSVLSDEQLGPALRDMLTTHPETHTEVLAEHFARHLEALRAGMA